MVFYQSNKSKDCSELFSNTVDHMFYHPVSYQISLTELWHIHPSHDKRNLVSLANFVLMIFPVQNIEHTSSLMYKHLLKQCFMLMKVPLCQYCQPKI